MQRRSARCSPKSPPTPAPAPACRSASRSRRLATSPTSSTSTPPARCPPAPTTGTTSSTPLPGRLADEQGGPAMGCTSGRAAGATRRRPAGRGPLRDALTQFDECGIVVVVRPGHPVLLAGHEWEAVLASPPAPSETTRFLIFGHGSWDQPARPSSACAPRRCTASSSPAGWICLMPIASAKPTPGWRIAHLPTPSARPISFRCRCLACPA